MADINWLEQVKLDAEKITKRRFEDDGIVPVVPSKAKSRVIDAQEAEIVTKK